MNKCIKLCEASEALGQWLYDWQTLIGGVLAVAAGIASVIFLRRQISQSEQHERSRLRRQQNAVRATLPLALNGLIDCLRRMLLALNAAKTEVRANRVASSFDPPATPTEYIVELQAVIASTDERSVIEPISEIIRQMQTLWARVDVLKNETEQRRRAGLEINIDEWIIQSAQIHALVESLFEYARAETEQGPEAVAWERAEHPIFHLGIESASLLEQVKRGLKKSPNFWSLK